MALKLFAGLVHNSVLLDADWLKIPPSCDSPLLPTAWITASRRMALASKAQEVAKHDQKGRGNGKKGEFGVCSHVLPDEQIFVTTITLYSFIFILQSLN